MWIQALLLQKGGRGLPARAAWVPWEVLSICTSHNPREFKEIQEHCPKARKSSHTCNVTIKPVIVGETGRFCITEMTD